MVSLRHSYFTIMSSLIYFPEQASDSKVGLIFLYIIFGNCGVVIINLVLFSAVVLCLWCRSKQHFKNQIKDTVGVSVGQIKNETKSAIRRQVVKCCCYSNELTEEPVRVEGEGEEGDSETIESENGLTRDLAVSYAKSIKATLEFARDDKLIYEVMKEEKILEVVFAIPPEANSPELSDPEETQTSIDGEEFVGPLRIRNETDGAKQPNPSQTENEED